jgi:hypothetical protein
MPRVSASNGIRPEIRALAVLQLGKTVTPKEINDHVGTGEYAAKYVSFLNTRYGFNITANKDGRRVVSYTVIAEPDNAAELRGATPKAPKAKAAKVAKAPAKAKVAATVDKEAIKAKNLETLKKVAAERSKTAVKSAKKAKRVPRETDYVRETFGSTGEIATSYNVDADWDSIDGVDLQKLVG